MENAFCEDWYIDDMLMEAPPCERGIEDKYSFTCYCEKGDFLCDEKYSGAFSDEEFGAIVDVVLLYFTLIPIFICTAICIGCCYCKKSCCFEKKNEPPVIQKEPK